MSHDHTAPRALVLAGALLSLALFQCSSPAPAEPQEPPKTAPAVTPAPNRSTAAAAWQTVYAAFMHPRCVNCHPAGDAPLQGDDSHPHGQNVLRGAAGAGRPGQRCDTCHQGENLPGPNLPPGAPVWVMPRQDMPLVFEGRSSRELCEQMRDPKRNGGRTPEQILAHVSHDPLVLWGWRPGEGRASVAVPHADLVRALRTWVDNGCGCPER